MKIKLIVLLAMTSFGQMGLAQDTASADFKKNTVHGSFGTWLFFIDGELTYERFFKKTEKSEVTLYPGVQFSAGITESFAYDTYVTVSPNFILLTGNSRSHFELNLGLNLFLSETNPLEFVSGNEIISEFSPNINLGYRFQNMQKSRFVYRVGLGWPTGLYMGAGWNF